MRRLAGMGLLIPLSLAACASLRPSPPQGAIGTPSSGSQASETVKNAAPPPGEPPPPVASTPEVQPAPAGQATTAGAAETTVTATPAPPAAPAAPPPTIKPAVAGAARSKAPNSKSSAPNSKSSAKNPPTDEPTTPTATPPAIPPATQASVAKAPEKPPAPPALDLASLEQRLRDTHAIGIFTKLSLKNQVDDLLGAFRAFHGGQDKISLADLRQRYDLLLLKVLTLLQDGDPPLASAISASREALWGVLADREKFQKIQLG